MTAHVGDQILIMSQLLHQPVRDGEILSVREGAGGTAYLVRWSDSGHESLLWPGADAIIKHLHGCGEHPREREAVTAGHNSVLRLRTDAVRSS